MRKMGEIGLAVVYSAVALIVLFVYYGAMFLNEFLVRPIMLLTRRFRR